jgi:hypothetical protein
MLLLLLRKQRNASIMMNSKLSISNDSTFHSPIKPNLREKNNLKYGVNNL